MRDRVGRGWLVNYHGRAVQDIDRAWDTMLTKLGLLKGREWRSYLLRHSLTTLARNRGATKWDLEVFMGHSDGRSAPRVAQRFQCSHLDRVVNCKSLFKIVSIRYVAHHLLRLATMFFRYDRKSIHELTEKSLAIS